VGPGDHAGTYRGHVVGMRAGTRAIEYIQEHDLLAHARDLGEYVQGRLRDVADGNDRLAVVRGRVCSSARSSSTPRGTRTATSSTPSSSTASSVGSSSGRPVATGACCGFLPPLVLTHDLAETALDVVVEAIEATTAEAKRTA